MKTLMISTGGYRTTYFKVDTESGAISYLGSNPSGDWLMLGIKHVKRNSFIPLTRITPELLETMDHANMLFYKNGKCQWTVRDRDHGTVREWGSPRVTSIWYSDDPEFWMGRQS